jgi:uncharacterized protein (DUF433 family)
MPLPPNPVRDAAIVNFRARGWTHKKIATRYGLSAARINQILAASRQRRKRKRAA